LALAIALVGFTLALTLVPDVRRFRTALLTTVLCGVGGGFAGVLGTYVSILGGLLLWTGLRGLAIVDGDSTVLNEGAPWLLLGSYVAGTLAGGAIGWEHVAARVSRWSCMLGGQANDALQRTRPAQALEPRR
jgi:hypothetical protein